MKPQPSMKRWLYRALNSVIVSAISFRAVLTDAIVVFSGGASAIVTDCWMKSALRDGGANGSIIGRNTFQRPREEALALLSDIINIYKTTN